MPNRTVATPACLAAALAALVTAAAAASRSAVRRYPTLGEINKRAAGSFYTPALFGARTRRLVRLLLRLG